MKKIIALLMLIVPVFFINALDIEKEKSNMQMVLNNIISSGISPFENKDEEFKAFDSKISNITNGQEQFSETLKYSKKYSVDIDKDGKNDLSETIDIRLEKSDENILSLSITSYYNIEKFYLKEPEVVKNINVKKSSFKLVISAKWNQLKTDDMLFGLELSGILDYQFDTEVKTEFNLLNVSKDFLPFDISGKIKINNIESDYNVKLADLLAK